MLFREEPIYRNVSILFSNMSRAGSEPGRRRAQARRNRNAWGFGRPAWKPCWERCRAASGSRGSVTQDGVPLRNLNSGEGAVAYGGKSGSAVATRSNGGTHEPWHLLRLHPTSHSDGREGSLLVMPPPRKALRHALPVVLEGVVGPLVVFYLLLVIAGFRGALIAALTWSYLARRRLLKGERVSMLLLFGTILITLRTVVAFVTGSAFITLRTDGRYCRYLLWPYSSPRWSAGPSHNASPTTFRPMDPAIMRRPLVRRLFIRISVLWATCWSWTSNPGLCSGCWCYCSLRSLALNSPWWRDRPPHWIFVHHRVRGRRRDGASPSTMGEQQLAHVASTSEPRARPAQTGER